MITGPELKKALEHMNAHHDDAILRYAQVYGGVVLKGDAQKNQVKMADLQANQFTVQWGPKANQRTVPIDPPLESATDARNRFVQMDIDCRAKLGLSTVVFNRYDVGPNLFVALAIGCAFIGLTIFTDDDFILGAAPDVLATFSSHVFARLHPAFDYFGFAWPSAPIVPVPLVAFGVRVLALAPVFAIHLAEYLFITRPLLNKYNCTRQVARDYWLAATLICGFPAWSHYLSKARESERQQKLEQSKVSGPPNVVDAERFKEVD